ncbi:MAG TPA: lysoplasmalogenase [Anaerolineae bacterium]|nr:lysoplasmalogenase [Anaerolineae bacterium]
MKLALFLVPPMVVLVFLLIRAEFALRKKQIYLLKPLCTVLVILMAALSLLEPTHNPTYTWGVLLGLLFSFGGDVLLMFQDDPRYFRLGLVSFLIAQVVYALVFGLLGRFSSRDLLTTALLAAAGLGLFLLMAPNLGQMRIPVLVYIVVISLMVSRAVSTAASPLFTAAQAWLVAAGALLFYVSDGILALNRFWKAWPYHRISLAFYYAGQALIALAASYFVVA